MGRVVFPVTIESLEDVYRAHRGALAADQVRRIDVADALIDTGATGLSLPRGMIARLGLLPLQSRRAMTTSGIRDVPTFGAVRLTLQGRDCVCDVIEVDDACPVFVGQVPLELLDFLVNPSERTLVANPAHGGQHMIEIL